MSDLKKELKYYVPLFMGFSIMMIALLAPPLGTISTSAIYGGGCFLILCAAVVGLDIPKILHEVNELKRLSINEINRNNNEEN